MHRPEKARQMTTPLELQAPVSAYVGGVLKKTYSAVSGVVMSNFATYGGTETTANGLLSVEDTATITTWFRPDIKSDCRVKRLDTGAVYEVIGEPENIEARNMFLVFKVRRVKGGA